MSAFIVVNPRAARSRSAWPRLREELEMIFPQMEVATTHAPGQAARLVRDALKDGHLEIVAVGGDGTANEAVNGFFEHGEQVSPDAVLGLVPTGAANDLARGLGMPADMEDAITFLRRARIRPADVGLVSCLDVGGAPAYRYFLNAASFGITALEAAARRARFPALARPLALAGWRAPRVRLMTDTGHDEIAGISAVVVANGRFFAGGLDAAPDAQSHDGLFDIKVVGGRRRAAALAALHGPDPFSRLMRAGRLTAVPVLETRGRIAVECDGEAAGTLPATFEILPGAINLRC